MSDARFRIADVRARLASCPGRVYLRLHRIPELRVKLKSLAVEIRIIKAEISRAARGLRSKAPDTRTDAILAVRSMTEHVIQLRRIFRAAVVALGFLRGRLFREIEPAAHLQGEALVPLLDEVEKHVIRFGPPRAARPGNGSFPEVHTVHAMTDATWAAWRADAIASVRDAGPGSRKQAL